MNSLQLRYALLNSIDNNIAVCAKDQLKYVISDSFACIVNSQSSNEKGLHWVSFYKQPGKPIEYFDSLGLSLDNYGKEFVNFATKFGSIVYVNDTQYQSNNSSCCGHFCIYFLIKRDLNVSYAEILSKFSSVNLLENEKIVKRFVEKKFNFPSFSNCESFCKDRCLKDGISLSSVCFQENGSCIQILKKYT